MNSNQCSPLPGEENIYFNGAGQYYRAATPANTADCRIPAPSKGLVYLVKNAPSGFLEVLDAQQITSTYGNSDPSKYPGYVEPEVSEPEVAQPATSDQ